jgi:hypothetical protein
MLGGRLGRGGGGTGGRAGGGTTATVVLCFTKLRKILNSSNAVS